MGDLHRIPKKMGGPKHVSVPVSDALAETRRQMDFHKAKLDLAVLKAAEELERGARELRRVAEELRESESGKAG